MHGFKQGFSQFISYLFHPGIMPTVGALFVLWSVPETYSWSTIFKITSTVFVGTYASPLIAIVLFRTTKIISSVHLIKRFFSESMTNADGEEVSTREIKKILEDTVAEENKRKPMTDDALAKILKEKGYPIARRTVAKYREQLDIPVARMRKEL